MKTQKRLDFLLLIANNILPQFCHIFHLDCCVIFLTTGAKFIFNCPPKYETYFTRTTLRPCWNIYRLSFSCSSLAIQGWIRPGTFSGRGRKNSGEVAIGLRPKSFGPSRKAFSQGRSQPHFETNSLINTSLREERRETVLLGFSVSLPDQTSQKVTRRRQLQRLDYAPKWKNKYYFKILAHATRKLKSATVMQSLHAVGSFFCQSNFSSCSKKFATRVEKGIFFLFSKDGEIWSYALSMRSFSSTPSLQISSPNQR